MKDGMTRAAPTLGLGAVLLLIIGIAPALAAPTTPTVTDNANGTVRISGSGADWWHLALSSPASGSPTTYVYPDISSGQTVYTPPRSASCVSVSGRAGGDAGGGGTYGTWSGPTCATYAFPDAPTVTDNDNGTVKIAGTGHSFWHIALKSSLTSASTTYLFPDVPAVQTVYAPPATAKCVSVQGRRGGTGVGGGQLGSYSGFTCATGSVSAAPAAPKVYDNANGTVSIIASGNSFWHIARQPSAGGVTTYPSPDEPASGVVYTPPIGTPCVSVEAQTGGTGYGDGTLGSWSGFTCATGSAAFPNVTATLVEDGATVRAVSTTATKLRFTAFTSASGADPLSQEIAPNAQGIATFRPIADHPYVDVVALRGPEAGTRLRDERGGDLVRTSPPAPNGNTIVGTNNAGGWGVSQATTIRNGHITWARTEPGQESVAMLRSEGFRVLQIVGNTDDRTPLSAINPITYADSVVADYSNDPNADLLQAGNEMYFKGGACDPARYARLYMGAEAALRAANVTQPFLFNLTGTLRQGCTQGSSTEWLQSALDAEPGLAAKIVANGVTLHPYGAKYENAYDTDGTLSVNAQENLLRNKLGVVPPIYLTEFGFNTCGPHAYVPDDAAATAGINSTFPQFLADPLVKGIWYFQSHDYSSANCWGFMNDDGTTRPQYDALSNFAKQQRQ